MAEGKRGAALVTGGARRIGRALVLACADAGFDVAIHCRAIDDEAEAAAAETELGPITLLVNSASLFERDSFDSMSRASWHAHMEVNVRAPLVLSQAFARRLPKSRQGLIVNLLDQRVWRPTPEFFSYALSKSALWEATRLMAQTLAPRVRVNGIGPGPTLASIHQDDADFAREAEGTLMGKPVHPIEIGQALRYLIDAPSVTGQMIAVDAGQHLGWQA